MGEVGNRNFRESEKKQMFTRKHFKAVAKIIAGNRGQGVEYTLDNIASELADYFATQNPRFDRNRFMKACAVED